MVKEGDTNLVCVSTVGFFLNLSGYTFISKEFCLLDCDSNFLYHKTIKPPKSSTEYSITERQRILSKTSNVGLEFDSGEIELDDLIKIVHPMIKGKRVIVQDRVTARWLKKIFNTYTDFECVAVGEWFEVLPCMNDGHPDVCDYHNDDIIVHHCALFDVLGLKKSIATIIPHLSDPKYSVCVHVTGFDLYDEGDIVKEICILQMTSTEMFHTTVKSPKGGAHGYQFHKSLIEFETKFGNGLEYEGGEMTFDEMIEKTLPLIKGKRVFVKDFCTMLWLREIYKSHADLDLIHCGDPKGMLCETPKCFNHQKGSQWKKYCAKKHAWLLRARLLDLYEKTVIQVKEN